MKIITYKPKKLSIRRNLFTNIMRYVPTLLQMSIKAGIPKMRVQIETINKCNVRCPTCWVPDMKRQRGKMSMEQFASIIDQLPHGITIIPYNSGEPLLDKDIWKKVKYAHKHEMQIQLSTNGTLLHKYDPTEILSSGLNTLYVTVESTRKDVHESYRKGSDFDKVVESLKILCETKRKLTNVNTKIVMLTLITRKNENELPAISEMAEEIDVDELFFKSFHLNINASGKEYNEWVPQQNELSRYSSNSSEIKNASFKSCLAVTTPVIYWNGDVTVCCHDLEGEYVFGNVFKTPFSELWNGKRYNELRKRILCRSLNICKKCYAVS